MPYLAKSRRADFNNGLEGDSNSGPILAPWRLFESDPNNGPSPGHFNLVSDEVYICSGLLLMVSWKVPYWPRAASLTSIMAWKLTWIVTPFWPPGIYLSPTWLMAPPQAISILCQMKYTSVQVSYLWFPGRCHIWPKAAGLTWIMARGDSKSGPILAPGVYLSLTRIMAPPQAISVLCQMAWQDSYLFAGAFLEQIPSGGLLYNGILGRHT